MASERIDLISEYCDRWCERCAFTEQCSSFAVHVAVAMCEGDYEAAIDLAVVRPPSVLRGDDEWPDYLDEIATVEPTEAEIGEVVRLDEARRARVREAPLSKLANGVRELCVAWLEARHGEIEKDPLPAVREALEIVTWNAWLIEAKINRGLSGRDRAAHGECPEEDPVQNDWSGSAKVALILIERSSVAWDVIADATGDGDARRFSDELKALQRELERVFPDARRFRRPGFDA